MHPCVQVIIGLLRSAMIKSGAKDFLIDGFPRAMDQAQRFEEMIKPCKCVGTGFMWVVVGCCRGACACCLPASSAAWHSKRNPTQPT